ncbi:carbohydrate porin [Malikia spinosa]|jgi:hypothetical protein|uniref:Porin n=1 Tax=Malikia spinosa TaxID=86180 RepID=A0A7C9N479_9BURK|nr:carbohydrate porin [Malikia spinosa]MYZ53700.1 hypothetical protein [Malikia spinosa]OGB71928.1 MAG: hypothetical protein A2486_03315 [Burkholderiales bacterium RIFOXYC12_FULL_65_23]
MSKTFKLAAVAALCAAAAVAHADVKFDANFEGDTTNTSAATDSFKSGGRIEVNANAELLKQGDNFVNARASLLLGLNADSTVDDAWIQFGNSSVDLKIGRFEALDLFPVAKDTVLDPATGAGYRANIGRGRFKDGQFHGALGLNAAPGLRFELGVVNYKDGTPPASGAAEQVVRPAVSYTTGDLTLRAGFESFDMGRGAGTQTGYGLSAGYMLAKDAVVNVNYGNSSDLDASSVGANLVYGPAGIGYIKDKTGATTVDTVYAAYSFPLLGVKGAFITPAISVSSGDGVADKTALRVRLNYQF